MRIIDPELGTLEMQTESEDDVVSDDGDDDNDVDDDDDDDGVEDVHDSDVLVEDGGVGPVVVANAKVQMRGAASTAMPPRRRGVSRRESASVHGKWEWKICSINSAHTHTHTVRNIHTPT